MLHNSHGARAVAGAAPFSYSRLIPVCLSAAFLTKLAKHLALLACLMILGKASGRFVIGPPAIFLLVFLAAVIHFVGSTLERRSRMHISPFKGPS
jgi:hypothetical protein